MGLKYSAHCGIADSRTRIPEISTAGRLCSLPTHCYVLGRIGALLSILSYAECPYIHLLIYVWFARGAVKIVREHSTGMHGARRAVLGGVRPPSPPPPPPPTSSTATAKWLQGRRSRSGRSCVRRTNIRPTNPRKMSYELR